MLSLVPLPLLKEIEGVATTSIEEVYEPIDGYDNLALANVSDVLNIREVPIDGTIVAV